MSRVVHFEITANDPEKICTFYTDVFGWKITKYPGPQDYWLVTTGRPFFILPGEPKAFVL